MTGIPDETPIAKQNPSHWVDNIGTIAILLFVVALTVSLIFLTLKSLT